MLDGGVGLRELTLNALARRAGMAKSNVYRYFETREALLLELLWGEWVAWFQGLLARPPRRGTGSKALEALVRRVAHDLAARPRLCALTAALPSVVEQNVSEETLAAFKAQSLAFFREIARFLHARVPDLTEARYAQLVHDAVAVLTGLYPFATPAPAVARVLERPELAFFRRDLATDLARILVAIARA